MVNTIVLNKRETNAVGDARHEGSNVGPHVCVNPLQLLNALTTRTDPHKQHGLLYMDAFVNRVPVKVMVDSGATHNFVAERVVTRLKLELNESPFLSGSGKVNVTLLLSL
jgi:hypothetical protein